MGSKLCLCGWRCSRPLTVRGAQSRICFRKGVFVKGVRKEVRKKVFVKGAREGPNDRMYKELRNIIYKYKNPKTKNPQITNTTKFKKVQNMNYGNYIYNKTKN